MMLLPKKVGSFTLMRKLDADGTTEAYVGILDEPAGKQVVARRAPPQIARDPARMDAVRARVGDLTSIRHPGIVAVLDLVEADGDVWILEEWTDAVELRAIIHHCARVGSTLPHNVFLNVATQICNGLEALHGRPGQHSGAENVLHMALCPSAILLTTDGRVVLGGFGLACSPATAGSTVTGTLGGQLEYLCPEQTHQDQKLSPASDIFALGTILYELLTTRPMFRAESTLQTIHRVRRAEVTTQLLEVKELLPGLDKVLFRALSLNPRHRYQRAFVLREDLRGLMAGFSFSDIDEVTVAFLQPILKGTRGGGADELVPALGPDGPAESTAALLAGFPDVPSRDFSDPGEPLSDPGLDTDLGDRIDTGWEPVAPGPDASAPPLARRPLVEEDSASFGLSRDPLEPTTGPLLEHSSPFSVPLDETAPSPIGATTAAFLRGDTLTSPDDETLPDGLDQHTVPSARPTPVIVPAEPPVLPPHDIEPDTAPEPEPEPLKPILAKLAPAETLMPPESVRPPPARRETPPPPPGRLFEGEDLEPAGPSWVPIALGGGAMLVAAVAVFVCLGVGGGAVGVIATGAQDGGSTTAVAVAPAPALVADPTKPAASEPPPAPEPPSEVVAVAATPTNPAPAPAQPPREPAPPTTARVPRPAPPPEPVREVPPPRETFDAVAMVEPLREEPAAAMALEVDIGDIQAWSTEAFAGRLSPQASQELAAIPTSDPEFTRARTLLYLDAKARGSTAERHQQLALLMSLPENQYNPVLLVEEAQDAIAAADYARALERAGTAEQHWARLPSDLVYTRKAMIYEVQALAHTGLFYASEGDDLDELVRAIRGWERYRRHVATRDSRDLLARADQNLDKLYEIQRRVD